MWWACPLEEAARSATSADGDSGRFGLVGVPVMGVVGEDGAGVSQPPHQPGAAGFVAIQRALSSQLSEAEIGGHPSYGSCGGQVEDTKGEKTTVGRVAVPPGFNSRHKQPKVVIPGSQAA